MGRHWISDTLKAEAMRGLRNGRSLSWASRLLGCGFVRAKALAAEWGIDVPKHAVGRRAKGTARQLSDLTEREEDDDGHRLKRAKKDDLDFLEALRKEGSGHKSLPIPQSPVGPRMVRPTTYLLRSSVMGDIAEGGGL
jgi:hypothetical protein